MKREEIAEMFAELDGTARYDDALEEHVAYRSARSVENVRQWRINNPTKWRALNKRNKKAWRTRYPAKARAEKARAARAYRKRKAGR